MHIKIRYQARLCLALFDFEPRIIMLSINAELLQVHEAMFNTNVIVKHESHFCATYFTYKLKRRHYVSCKLIHLPIILTNKFLIAANIITFKTVLQ